MYLVFDPLSKCALVIHFSQNRNTGRQIREKEEGQKYGSLVEPMFHFWSKQGFDFLTTEINKNYGNSHNPGLLSTT